MGDKMGDKADVAISNDATRYAASEVGSAAESVTTIYQPQISESQMPAQSPKPKAVNFSPLYPSPSYSPSCLHSLTAALYDLGKEAFFILRDDYNRHTRESDHYSFADVSMLGDKPRNSLAVYR